MRAKTWLRVKFKKETKASRRVSAIPTIKLIPELVTEAPPIVKKMMMVIPSLRM
jgi:hypothetical protein